MSVRAPFHVLRRRPALTTLLALGCALVLAAACTPGGGDSAPSGDSGFQSDPSFVSNGVAERAASNYAQQCASCHGAAGDGRGPVGGALSPPPTDFTAARVPSHRAYEAIRGGGMAVGKAATMPGFASAFSDQDMHDLVAYIQAFAN